MNPFTALLISLPTGNSTLRMRMWRALKSTGCGVLRDGVYVLPLAASQAGTLAEVGAAVKSAGGFAVTAELDFKTPAEAERVRALFDRAKEYGDFVGRIAAAKTAMRRLGKRKAGTLVDRLRRSFDEIVAIDFYPGQARLQASEALADARHEMERLYSGGEPRSAKGTVRRLDPAKYRNRVWATRKNPWVDRLASAWLIKRFIDREARFRWLETPTNRPKGAIGFDFDDADFTHVGNLVTFEVLLSSFGLDDDAALGQIAANVHFLDVGGIPVDDARGLETILKGARDTARNDDDLVLAAGRVFDHAYAAYRTNENRSVKPPP